MIFNSKVGPPSTLFLSLLNESLSFLQHLVLLNLKENIFKFLNSGWCSFIYSRTAFFFSLTKIKFYKIYLGQFDWVKVPKYEIWAIEKNWWTIPSNFTKCIWANLWEINQQLSSWCTYREYCKRKVSEVSSSKPKQFSVV